MNHWIRNFILLALMLAASGMAMALRPTHKVADHGPKVDLEVMIPTKFADWREEKQSSAQIVDPQQKELIDRIYNQTLSRTYIRSDGYRIMLSIAYGSDQGDSMKVHKPEVCYVAQGFQVEAQRMDTLHSDQGSIPIKRVLAHQGNRVEPVTYWVTVGDKVVRPDLSQKLVQLSFGLTGKIPDGMLIRVSSIDQDQKNAFRIQDEFSRLMLSSVSPESRQRLAGDVN